MRALHDRHRRHLTVGLALVVSGCWIGGLAPAEARADWAVTALATAFPVGPYTSLYVDPADPRRVAIGTADGVVAWSEDGGASANEAQALSPRRYDASALRGRSTLSLLGRPPVDPGNLPVARGSTGRAGPAPRHPPLSPLEPRPANRAMRLFLQSMRDGTRFPRWAFWMGIGSTWTDVSGVAMPGRGGRMVAASSAGVILSDRGRRSWTRTLGGPGPMWHEGDLAATAVTIDPHDDAHVLAGTVLGVWESNDGGFTFAPHAAPSLRDEVVTVFQWDPNAPGTLYAIGDRVILRSDDAGRSFEAVYGSAAAINGVAFSSDAAFVATSNGLVHVVGTDERTLLRGRAVIGVVPSGSGVVVATDTELLSARPGRGMRVIAHTAGDDPFLALRGGPGLAWAITSTGVYRLSEAPVVASRPTARRSPHLVATGLEVETAVIEHLGLGEPPENRLHDRWYAMLLPRVVANVSGGSVLSDGLTHDGTFPVRFRMAEATSDATVEGSVFAVWDLSEIVFGQSVNPNLIIESGLRDNRERILREVRRRYRDAAFLVRRLERPPADPRAEVGVRLRLEEEASYLEALSGRAVVQGEMP